MKTKEEILDELISDRSSCDSFPEFIRCATIGAIENLVNDAMDAFAIEVAKETLRNAAENAIVDDWAEINKESILNENNIPEI